MSWSFNPFTGNLDIVGGGAVVFEGEVETFADLPETIGDPAVGASFLVRSSTGVWLVNRRQAGIWIRRNNTGVRATDWEYGGDYPVNSVNGQTGNVSLTAADVGVNFAAPPAIGNTTPNSGAFTTLTANNGTLTASAPVLDLSQTWNNSGTTFTGLLFNATNTASATESRLIDLQVGGTSQFNVTRQGYARAVRYDFPDSDRGIRNFGTTRVEIGSLFWFNTGGGSTGGMWMGVNVASPALEIGGGAGLGAGQVPVVITRDANHTLAQRSTTNPQTFRIYNTFTDASNYERGFMRWSSNVLQIGTEAAGTGSARNLEFHYGGTAQFRVFSQGINIRQSGALGFSSNGITGVDVALERVSAGVIRIADNTTNNPPALRINNANSTEYAALRWASNEFIFDANAGSGTLRGIKIGSATSSLLGFYGVTPVDQPATVADPAGGGTIDTEARTAIGEVIDRLQELGLIA